MTGLLQLQERVLQSSECSTHQYNIIEHVLNEVKANGDTLNIRWHDGPGCRQKSYCRLSSTICHFCFGNQACKLQIQQSCGDKLGETGSGPV